MEDLEPQELETQPRGERGMGLPTPVTYDQEDTIDKPRRNLKTKTKISFEEYKAMSNVIATLLRSLEPLDGDNRFTQYLTWAEVVEWYLDQMQPDIGASPEVREELRQKVTLVIRRLLYKENVLTAVGGTPQNRDDEPTTLLSVHPNYDV